MKKYLKQDIFFKPSLKTFFLIPCFSLSSFTSVFLFEQWQCLDGVLIFSVWTLTMESGGEKKEEKGPITFPPRSHYRSNILWGQYFVQHLKSNLKYPDNIKLLTTRIRKVAIARYFSMGDKFLNAKISKIILVVIFSTNPYNISIAPPFSFLKWYSN